MASVFMAPTFGSFSTQRCIKTPKKGRFIKALRIEKPLEELYNVRVERKVSPERLAELGVSRWSVWKTGNCKLPWDWHIDQLISLR
ncbi:hypothetical protein U1Q18_004068 [Sarracenia purpurea var. burkii]